MTSLQSVLSIGVYGYTRTSFAHDLRTSGTDGLVDIRRRRGVRGSEYAFANRGRLESLCAELKIDYSSAIELAPTAAIRDLQRSADAQAEATKRSRDGLSQAFVDAYSADVLNLISDRELLAIFEGLARPALLCVERLPQACHRSIVCKRLEGMGFPVHHLSP